MQITKSKRPKRADVRQMLLSGATEQEIFDASPGAWKGDVMFAIREVSATLDREERERIKWTGPRDVLYVSAVGVPVYDVGGGHAVHGEAALLALGFK